MKDLIMQLQREFDEAELRADQSTLRRLLADDFLSIGPKGFVLDKEQWIGRHVHFKYHTLTSSEVDVRLYERAAIVRNLQHNSATYHAQRMDHTLRVSQVWVAIGSEWRLAAIQFSPFDTAPRRAPAH